jgi:hypothetical protein
MSYIIAALAVYALGVWTGLSAGKIKAWFWVQKDAAKAEVSKAADDLKSKL